jgi:hypothetical protein
VQQANGRSKGKGKGSDRSATKELVVPDSEDEGIVAEGAKVSTGEEAQTVDLKNDACRRSARQRSRVSYADFEGDQVDDLLEAPVKVQRKQALQNLSKRKEQEAGEKSKQKTITDLDAFVYKKGKATEGNGSGSEGAEDVATRRSSRRALKDRKRGELTRARLSKRSADDLIELSGMLDLMLTS